MTPTPQLTLVTATLNGVTTNQAFYRAQRTRPAKNFDPSKHFRQEESRLMTRRMVTYGDIFMLERYRERREERGDDDVDDVKKDTSSRKMKKRYEVEPPCAQ